MRSRIIEMPMCGDYVIREVFLWWPMCLKFPNMASKQWRWLEKAKIRLDYRGITGWRFSHWASDDAPVGFRPHDKPSEDCNA